MKLSHFCLSIFGAAILFSATVIAGGNEYAVQIVISNTQLTPTDAKFKGVTDINEESFTGVFKYKYTTGKTTNLAEATATRAKMINAGFKDAFIVVYQDGVRTTNWAKTKGNSNTSNGNTTWTGTTNNGAWANTTPNPAIVNTINGATNNSNTGTWNNTTDPTSNTWTNTGNTTNSTTTTAGTTTNPTSTTNNANNTTGTTSTNTGTWTNTNSTGNTTTGNQATNPSDTWNNTTGTGTNTTPSTNRNNNENPTNSTTPSETPVETEPTSSTTTSPKKGLGYVVTETEAEFPGGYEGLQTFLQENLSQSQTSRMQKGEWKNVFVSFVIDRTGKVKNPQIVSGINTTTDSEVMRVMQMMPDWKPATIGTTAIEKQFVLPVGFYITEVGAGETTNVASKVN
jgi:hypothetical protein